MRSFNRQFGGDVLQRDESGANVPTVLSTHGFIFDVTCDQNAPDPEIIAQKVADALMWIEGCGEVNVGYLGPMPPTEERTGDSVV